GHSVAKCSVARRIGRLVAVNQRPVVRKALQPFALSRRQSPHRPEHCRALLHPPTALARTGSCLVLGGYSRGDDARNAVHFTGVQGEHWSTSLPDSHTISLAVWIGSHTNLKNRDVRLPGVVVRTVGLTQERLRHQETHLGSLIPCAPRSSPARRQG